MGFNGFTASGFEDVVDFAVSNNQLVHGHALLYPYANEAYWRDHPDDDTTSTVQAFLNLACSTRKGKVWLWDVVNEVFGFPGVHDMDDQGLRTEFREYTDIGNSPGDYIPLAFQWARECDPDATLILLEAGAEELSDVSDNMFSYVVRQRENGVPIDGVGFQMHVWGPQPDIPIKDWESVRANLERFANAGFRIFITEMDVMSAADSPPTVSQLQVQAEIFRTVSRLATTYSESLLLWDYADDRSWMHPSPFQLYDFPIGTFFYPTPWYGGAVDSTMTPKPAYFSLRDGLQDPPLEPFVWQRLQNKWEPETGYFGINGVLQPNGSTVEPSNEAGLVRLRNRWSASRYLTRDGFWNGQSWEPQTTVSMDLVNPNWTSQRWRIQVAVDGYLRFTNEWDSATGMLTRRGELNNINGGFDSEASLELNVANDEWDSQLWLLSDV